MKYDYKAVEAKWQKVWEDEKTFHVEIDHKKPKFYALVEFPYPSGAGLHVGHPRSYTALDVVSRKRRKNGYNVLYPMGWDAFGLPTENFAMKNHIHPAIVTKSNVDHFRSQLKALGITVHIRTVEWAAFIKEFVNKGHFDAIILAWTITLDPDIYDVWHSSRAKPGGLNFTGYRNAEVDELLVEARSMTDQDRRKELYDRVQEILDAEQPYCFLYVPYALPIVQARFQGIKPALNGIMYNFDRWWVPKDLQRYHVRP